MYEPRCWWWEMVEIARKLLLIAILGYFRSGLVEQLWTGVLISLISILLLVYFSPYVDPRLDAVSWASQTATLLTLLGGAALTDSQGPECDCDAFLEFLSAVLFIINLLPLLAIVYLIASTVADLYAVQRARWQPPPAAVLSDEAPRDGIAELSKGGSPEKLRVTRASGRDSSVAALADRAVLLEAKAHWKADSTFYKLAKVQLLAAPGHEGAPAADLEAGAPPWSMIVVNGKAVPCEEVTAVRLDERAHEFVVEHTRRSSLRAERLHLRMDTKSEFRLWRGMIDALRPEMIEANAKAMKEAEKAEADAKAKAEADSGGEGKRKSIFKPKSQRKSGQGSSSKGATLVAEEHVLLEGRMSVRISGSLFHVPMVLKLTAASDCAERKEPWTTFSYTSNHDTVAVPCRAISAVRIHADGANPSFEVEYVAPEARKESPEAEDRKNSLPRGPIRMRIWTTSQAQLEEWRTALAPLPLIKA